MAAAEITCRAVSLDLPQVPPHCSPAVDLPLVFFAHAAAI
jgi:hypothetical protein